jgi:acyl-CoA reductase-like NAD-dependent aldehyde dehydrogenase
MDVQHILQGTREQLSAHSEGIVHLISDESGLCLKDARREVQHVLSVLDYSTHASFLEGQPVDYPWGRLVTIQEPIWGSWPLHISISLWDRWRARSFWRF